MRKAAEPPKVEALRQREMAWSVLLRRSFAADELGCPVSGGRREMCMVAEHKQIVRTILPRDGTAADPGTGSVLARARSCLSFAEEPATSRPGGPDIGVDDLHERRKCRVRRSGGGAAADDAGLCFLPASQHHRRRRASAPIPRAAR